MDGLRNIGHSFRLAAARARAWRQHSWYYYFLESRVEALMAGKDTPEKPLGWSSSHSSESPRELYYTKYMARDQVMTPEGMYFRSVYR